MTLLQSDRLRALAAGATGARAAQLRAVDAVEQGHIIHPLRLALNLALGARFLLHEVLAGARVGDAEIEFDIWPIVESSNPKVELPARV